jgi:peptidoglycan hydrolase CwlO-like protein
VQADLDAWRRRLARTQAQLRATRERLVRLRARLATGRRTLAAVLRSRYTSDAPDFVSVVLEADGFAQVLERLDFLHRIQRSDTRIVTAVRTARDEAVGVERALARLEPRQREQTLAVERERNAVAGVATALRVRRDTLARARAAKLAALGATVAGRRRAERELSRLLAAQARAAGAVGPAARGRSRGRSCNASPAGRTSRPTGRRRRATTSSSTPPGGAWAAARRTPTRRRRRSRIASRRGCGRAAPALATGIARRSFARRM